MLTLTRSVYLKFRRIELHSIVPQYPMNNETSFPQNSTSSSQRSESPDIYGPSEPNRAGQLSGPGTTGAPSSVTASNGGTRTTSNPAPAVRAPTNIITELDHIVEQFREQIISKFGAIGLIASKFNFATTRNEPDKNRAFEQYLSTLESIEQHTLEAGRRGSITAQQFEPQPDPARGSSPSPQPDRYANETEAKAFIRSVMSEGGNQRKRTNDASNAREEESNGEDGDPDGSDNKQRLHEKDMPWFKRETMARVSANPSCIATRDILTQLAKDYGAVKQWILNSQSAPRGFPPSEWEHIIKGKPVDLDVVLSSLHHVSPVKESIGRLGSTEISLGRTEPIRRVQTSSEWTSAWNVTVDAYLFVFPHRETELRRYGSYIDREFSAKVVTAHRKIILYDIAVRNEVGGGNSTLLTERAEFSYIYSAIVMPDGIESEPGKTAGRAASAKPVFEICRRYNSANGCPNTASACRYQHHCSKCRRRGHPNHECDRDKKATQPTA